MLLTRVIFAPTVVGIPSSSWLLRWENSLANHKKFTRGRYLFCRKNMWPVVNAKIGPMTALSSLF
jgi:hypothetical protein